MKLFTKQAEDYLSSLKLQDGSFIINTKLKTGFLGFIICMRSLIGMFDQHVESKSTLKCILSHKMRQDHLESFFYANRSQDGFYNNPFAFQFRNAFRKLLTLVQIKCSEYGLYG